jgi:hypothetical protein
MAVGVIHTAYGLSPFISLALGTAILFAIVRFVGKRVDDQPHAGPAAGS